MVSRHGYEKSNIFLFFSITEFDLFQKCDLALHLAGQKLQPHSVVRKWCFKEHLFVCHFTHIVHGEVAKVPREQRRLANSAVLCMLLNVPAYLTKKKIPQGRNEQNFDEMPAGKSLEGKKYLRRF